MSYDPPATIVGFFDMGIPPGVESTIEVTFKHDLFTDQFEWSRNGLTIKSLRVGPQELLYMATGGEPTALRRMLIPAKKPITLTVVNSTDRELSFHPR